jgi:hypothetical protein
MAAKTLNAMQMCVTDDEAPFDRTDTVANPHGGQLRDLRALAAAEQLAPFVVARLWSAPVTDLVDLPFVRRAVGLLDGQPGIAAILEGRLELGSAHQLQVMLGARGFNTRQPRERYSV